MPRPRLATNGARASSWRLSRRSSTCRPNQRAVLILREVLGFSAREVAESLETTAASVNSALQRARAAVDERLPEQSQQATLRALGDERLAEIVDGYVDAWERGDVDAVVAMLAEDADVRDAAAVDLVRGRDAIALFLAGWPMSGDWRWRRCPGSRKRAGGARLLQLGPGGGGLSSVRAQRADLSRAADQRRHRFS